MSKPVDPEQLFDAIERIFEEPTRTVEAEKAEPNRSDALIDMESLLERVGGDRTLLAEMAGLFLKELPRYTAAVREAIARGDTNNLERAAHTLKGSVGNFVAHGAFEIALEVESMARSGNLAAAEAAWERLEGELEHLKPVLVGLGEEAMQ